MLCTIWLDAFILQVVAINLGTLCSTGKRINPTTKKNITRNSIGSKSNSNVGRANVVRDPTTMTNNAARRANEITPEGDMFRWQVSISFCIKAVFLVFALRWRMCSERVHARSYSVYRAG